MDCVSPGRRRWSTCLRSGAGHGTKRKTLPEQHPGYTHGWIISFEFCMLLPLLSQRGRPSTLTGRDAKRAMAPPASEPRQALRAVVGNPHAGDLLKRTVRLSGVAHQFRSIPVDLVEICAIRRQPVIAGAAANRSIDRSEGAISWNLRARRILRDGEHVAVDAEAAEVAVTEVRSKHQSVIRRDRQPAQFRGHACARVDRHDRANGDFAFCVDAADGEPV